MYALTLCLPQDAGYVIQPHKSQFKDVGYDASSAGYDIQPQRKKFAPIEDTSSRVHPGLPGLSASDMPKMAPPSVIAAPHAVQIPPPPPPPQQQPDTTAFHPDRAIDLIRHVPKQAMTLWDYQAQREDELSFRKGDVLTIHGPGSDPSWYDADDKNGHAGLVPSTHVRYVFDSLGLAINHTDGVYSVRSLLPGGAALESQLLQPGDIIHSINGVRIFGKGSAHVRDLVQSNQHAGIHEVQIVVLTRDARPEDIMADTSSFDRWRLVTCCLRGEGEMFTDIPQSKQDEMYGEHHEVPVYQTSQAQQPVMPHSAPMAQHQAQQNLFQMQVPYQTSQAQQPLVQHVAPMDQHQASQTVFQMQVPAPMIRQPPAQIGRMMQQQAPVQGPLDMWPGVPPQPIPQDSPMVTWVSPQAQTVPVSPDARRGPTQVVKVTKLGDSQPQAEMSKYTPSMYQNLGVVASPPSALMMPPKPTPPPAHALQEAEPLSPPLLQGTRSPVMQRIKSTCMQRDEALANNPVRLHCRDKRNLCYAPNAGCTVSAYRLFPNAKLFGDADSVNQQHAQRISKGIPSRQRQYSTKAGGCHWNAFASAGDAATREPSEHENRSGVPGARAVLFLRERIKAHPVSCSASKHPDRLRQLKGQSDSAPAIDRRQEQKAAALMLDRGGPSNHPRLSPRPRSRDAFDELCDPRQWFGFGSRLGAYEEEEELRS